MVESYFPTIGRHGSRANRYHSCRGSFSAIFVDIDIGLMQYVCDIQIDLIGHAGQVSQLAVKSLNHAQRFELLTQIETAFNLKFWHAQVDLPENALEFLQDIFYFIFIQVFFKSTEIASRHDRRHGIVAALVGQLDSLVIIKNQRRTGVAVAHHLDRLFRAIESEESLISCVGRVKSMLPGTFKVNRVGNHQPGQFVKHSFRDQVFDFIVSLGSYPKVDSLAGLFAIGKVDQLQACIVIFRKCVQKVFLKFDILLNPKRVSHIEFQGLSILVQVSWRSG